MVGQIETSVFLKQTNKQSLRSTIHVLNKVFIIEYENYTVVLTN